MSIVEKLKFDKEGLMPVIVQDYQTQEVLMLAYMNKEAFEKTIQTGKTHFWSRSRKKMWLKGEESRHFQYVKGIFFDCDIDTLLVKVVQESGACHEGYRSCFFRKADVEKDNMEIVGEKVFEPEQVYHK
jgi:phosphoribosyl-AMP cyclohydrolase